MPNTKPGKFAFDKIQYQPATGKKAGGKSVKMKNQTIDGMFKPGAPQRNIEDQESVSDSDSDDLLNKMFTKPQEVLPPSDVTPFKDQISELLNDDVSSIIIKDNA